METQHDNNLLGAFGQPLGRQGGLDQALLEPVREAEDSLIWRWLDATRHDVRV
ncbi:MAG: hypothetical protein WCP34_11290 [Pseudomonadota bacterium]